MCGRYTLHQKTDDLAKRYNLAQIPHDVPANYNVAPGQIMPVITEETGNRQLQFMQWGLIPFWAKDPRIGYKLINARDDTIFDKPTWRSVILHKRCLVPADGFYEWQQPPKGSTVHKQPFYIHPKDQNIFSFAGIWETWQDPSGQPRQTFSIITTAPNKEMAAIHDRMPVILRQADETAWLDTSTVTRSGIKPLLRPYEDNELEIYKVSDDVNSPRHNDEHLIYALS